MMISKYFKNVNLIQQANRELIEENIAQTKLISILGDKFFPTTNFSLKNFMILHVINEIVINNHKTIVEFGAGYSTFVLNEVVNKFNLDIKVYCIEHDSEWINFLKHEYDINKIEFIHAELNTSFKFKEKKYFWYDTDIIEAAIKNSEIDLCLIDGPKAGIESLKFSRYYASVFLKNKLSQTSCIFLDDTRREAEKEIIQYWSNEMNLEFVKKHNYSYSRNNFNKYSSVPL